MNSKELIKSKSLKFTPARETLLDIFEKSSKPISYEDIRDGISMDKATFYRNVSAFENIGLLQSFESNDKKRYYHICKKPHNHFVCNICNRIECLNEIDNTLVPNNYLIQNVIIYGKCAKCNKKKSI
jgi:Fur family transcriptional regulator, ferric uptake regulator